MIHSGTTSKDLTRKIASWVHRQSRLDLPDEVQHHARRMVLDHLGGVVASSVGEVSGAVANHVRRTYGEGPATAIGLGRATALGAAVLNGTNGHGIEADDGYTPGSFHPTSVILPAVFAVGQERNLEMVQVLRAAAIGMELGCRIAASGHPATRKKHFHNTPVAGVFGAAAAVAVLRGLSEEGIANALGIAGSHAAGLFEFLGSSAEVKRYHAGKAARDGIASADLAESGLTGPVTVLEGPEGYFAAYAGEEGVDWRPEAILDQLGERWVVRETYVKPYPCCRHLHGALDAAIQLRDENGVDSSAIEEIHVGTFAIAANHNGTDVRSMMGAQLSLPYSIAVALRRGKVTLQDFFPDAREDCETQALMEKVRVELDDAANKAYPLSGRPAEVTLRLAGGSEISRRVERPYGEYLNPMSDEDLEQKVRALAVPVIGEEGARYLAASAWHGVDLSFLDEIDRMCRAGIPTAQ